MKDSNSNKNENEKKETKSEQIEENECSDCCCNIKILNKKTNRAKNEVPSFRK